MGAGTGDDRDGVPGIAVDQVFGRDALEFIVAAIGDTAPAEAELAGKGAGLADEAGGRADRLGGTRHAAQGPTGADEGFIRAVMVFTGEADAAEVVLRSGDFRIEGSADGFALLFQAGEGGKQGAEARFRGGKEADFGRKAGVIHIAGEAVLDGLHEGEQGGRAEVRDIHTDGALRGSWQGGIRRGGALVARAGIGTTQGSGSFGRGRGGATGSPAGIHLAGGGGSGSGGFHYFSSIIFWF